MPSAEQPPPDLEAVFVDGFGTLVELRDPVPALRAELRELGVERSESEVRDAFAAEAAYYRPRSHTGHDHEALTRLRLECVGVFLRHARVDVAPEDFIDGFMRSLRFQLIPGATGALAEFRRAGLAIVCVANWDVSLHDLLVELEVRHHFDAVVTSADARVEKPHPGIFEHALTLSSSDPRRTVHIGDEEVDWLGAAAAGVHYAAPPLATAPARLGLTESSRG